MIRSKAVLPEPDGPRSAKSSPLATLRSTPSSALNAPKLLTTPLASMVMRHVLVDLTFQESLGDQRDQREHRQQRGDRERGHHLVLVVEDLDQQRHRVGLAADVA